MMYSNYYFTLPKVCHPKAKSMASQLQHSYRPKMNVQQNDEQIILEFALSGVLKEDVKMSIKDQMLILEANRKSVYEEKNYHYREFDAINFKSSIQIPEDVATDSVQAQFQNGVLRISLKKVKKPIIQVEIK